MDGIDIHVPVSRFA